MEQGSKTIVGEKEEERKEEKERERRKKYPVMGLLERVEWKVLRREREKKRRQ